MLTDKLHCKCVDNLIQCGLKDLFLEYLHHMISKTWQNCNLSAHPEGKKTKEEDYVKSLP